MENQFFWMLFGFILSIMVFSFIFGDNPLFRIATYFFIGVSSAYVFILLWFDVIVPKLISPLFNSNPQQLLLQLIPLLLSLMLLFKLFNKKSQIGNIPLAILVGSGAALILSGAFFGTLSPMLDMVTDSFSLASLSGSRFFGGIFMIFGVVSTLLYFSKTSITKSNEIPGATKVVDILHYFGKFFIGLTLGSIFAGVIISSIIALIERSNFIVSFIYNLFAR